jgi:hypothetical protein
MPDPLHVRAQIRAAVKAKLLQAPQLSLFAARIENARRRPLASGALPTAFIYTVMPANPEQSKLLDLGDAPTLERRLMLAIEGVAEKASTPLEDLIDQMAAQIETRIGARQKLGNLIKEMTLARTNYSMEAVGDREVGGARLEFEITYLTEEGAPTVAL